MVTISIASLIYKSKKFADWIYNSIYEFTPLLRRQEAEFFFVANDPTDELLAHLQYKKYRHYVNINPQKTELELFSMGYSNPEYIHRVYRGWNKAITLSRGEIVVLVNSDNYVSPDWLENLLKYLSSKTIVCSKLVERMHPKYNIFPGAYHGEFGCHPDNFNREAFLRFCERVKMTGLQKGGAYMPCAFYKRSAIEVGLYPEGNLAGASVNDVIAYGDQIFFEKLSNIGVMHVTAMDSIVYHCKEGEMDEHTNSAVSILDYKIGTGAEDQLSIPAQKVDTVTVNWDGERQYLSSLQLVSIITPTYNSATYLDETIQSVLTQDYPCIEYIVLDDGSTDNTPEVLKKYEGRLIWETHSNMGETLTVNRGLSMARGEIIAVVNSDDPLLPGAVSAAVASLQAQPDVLVVYPDWNYIDANSKVTSTVRVPEYDYLYMLRRHRCLVGPGAFIRRKALELAGMRDPEFKYVADFEYWLRLGLYGKFARISKVLATFRVHPGSASIAHKGKAMADEHIRLLQKLYSRPDLPPKVLKVRAEAFCWARLAAGMASGPIRLRALGYFLRDMLCSLPSFRQSLDQWHKSLILLLPEPLLRILVWLWQRVRSIFWGKWKVPVARLFLKTLFKILLGLVAFVSVFFKKDTNKNKEPKFALVSHVLPPSWSGQAVMIGRLLRGLDTDRYCLISRQSYSDINSYLDKLPGKYYYLGKAPQISAVNRFKLGWVCQAIIALLMMVFRTRRIASIARDEKCNALIACTGDLFDLPAGYLASRIIGIPFYSYIFDYYSCQWTDPLHRFFAQQFESILLKGSAGIVVPNEFLRDELQKRYGVASVVVHNPCEISEIETGYKAPWPANKDEIRIVYTGAIYHAHYDAFHDLLTAISLLKQPGLKLQLYTAQSPKQLMEQNISGPVVTYHNHLPPSEIQQIQKNADILFLPLAFNSSIPEVIRTSAPGKIGEYLASGRPVLVYAPSDSFVVWYFKSNYCGIVIDRKNPVDLANAIRLIIDSADLRDKLREDAFTCAQRDFNLKVVQSKFLQLLQQGTR